MPFYREPTDPPYDHDEDPDVNSYDRELGALAAKMQNMEADMVEMRADVKAIRTTLSEARGGWKAIILIAGISSTITAAAIKAFPFLLGRL